MLRESPVILKPTSDSDAVTSTADERGELLPPIRLGELVVISFGLKGCSGAKERALSRTSEPRIPDDRHAESISRAFSLRRILRTQFARRGTQPNQKDADISTKWSEETMKVLEAGGASGLTLQRQVQLFASVTLLEVELGRKPKPEQLAPFLEDILGAGGALALTREDWDALNTARAKMSALIADPKWSMVHGPWRAHCDELSYAFVAV